MRPCYRLTVPMRYQDSQPPSIAPVVLFPNSPITPQPPDNGPCTSRRPNNRFADQNWLNLAVPLPFSHLPDVNPSVPHVSGDPLETPRLSPIPCCTSCLLSKRSNEMPGTPRTVTERK